MTDFFSANLAVLRTLHPDLAGSVEAAPEIPGAEVLATRDEDRTARVARPDGTTVTLHSRFDPRAEARRFVQGVNPEAPQGFLVLGFGMGYHLQALADAANPESRILVLEKHPALLRLAASHRDLRTLFTDKRILWLIGLSRQELYMALRAYQQMLMSAELKIMPHGPSTALDADYYAESRQAIRDFAISGQMAIVSGFLLARKSLANQFRNLPLYVGATSLAELKPLYAGRPGIVVSAGPSLRRNIDRLREARGRAVLVACDIVLKPLLERGIVPDFTAVVDYQGQTMKFFETLPPKVDTRLVAISPAYFETVRIYPGPLAFAGDHIMDGILDSACRDMGGHCSGGNVGHFCYLIACHLGLEPIAFVGQDMSFPLNIGHLPGTPKHEEWQSERNRFYTLEMHELELLFRRRKDLLKVPAQGGGEVFSERSMYHYLRELEMAIKGSGRRTIDCTEGGARKEGVEPRTLAEFLAECPPGNMPPTGAGPTGLDRRRLAAAVKDLDNRIIELLDVKAAVEQKIRTHRRIAKALADNEPADRYIRSAMEIAERIHGHRKILALLQDVACASFFRAGMAHRAIGAKSGEEDDKLRDRLERDDVLIKDIAEAVEFLEPLLREARRRCAELAQGGEQPRP